MSRDYSRFIPLLMADFGFKQSASNENLYQGLCPNCSQKELWTKKENPFYINCNRQNNCNHSFTLKDQYSSEFENFNKRYSATTENPNAVADAYMTEARGFELSKILGFYSQGDYHNKTATVKFKIDDAATSERLIEPPKGSDKNRNLGPYSGKAWQAPNMRFNDGDTVYVTEGVIDAISLIVNGYKAIASISSKHYPTGFLSKHKHKDITWVWSLDNDYAGKTATRDNVATQIKEGFKNVRAMQVPHNQKKDWNDLHIAKKLKLSDIEKYRYHGDLLLAESAKQKAELIYSNKGMSAFLFDFNNQFFWADLNKKNEEDAPSITKVSNARPEFLYFQKNDITDESWFYAKVNFPKVKDQFGKYKNSKLSVNLSFSPAQVSSAADFKKRLASAGGAWFTGTTKQLDFLCSRTLSKLKQVQTVEFLGYDKATNAYIFNDFAVKNGEIVKKNNQDYFDFSGLAIKSLAKNEQMELTDSAANYVKIWAQLVYDGYGTNGMIACVFWFATLFAEQVRDTQDSFPFLEVVGAPNSGKTTLLSFLWRLIGFKSHKGTDPNKNSLAGNQRKMAALSNLPVVFIEADRAENSSAKRFDWEEIKPYYNGMGLRARGMKNSGNEIYEPPFRASLVIEQNYPVSASDAVLERIVQLNFSDDNYSDTTKKASDALSNLCVNDLSYFVINSVKNAKKILAYVKRRTPEFQKYLLNQDGVDHTRLALNHAQIMAFVEPFFQQTGLPEYIKKETLAAIRYLCKSRQSAIDADHPLVEEFFEVVNYLKSKEAVNFLDHSLEPNLIAISLNQIAECAKNHGQQIAPLVELKKLLKSSRKYEFIDSSRAVKSCVLNKTVRCWVFKLPSNENGASYVEK